MAHIEDYAFIGDCQTAALIAKDGSIDWLCFPRFDSAACFAALLGTPEHGRWRIAPVAEEYDIRRCYREGTLILETTYTTQDGVVTLIDCMPPRTQVPDLVRMVVGQRGQVQMQMELCIRFDYGSLVPWVRRENHGILAVAGPDTMHLHSAVETYGENFRTLADFTVSAGERIPFVLTWHPSHHATPKPIDAEEAIAHTEEWWRDWSNRCTYSGPWRDAVLRSLITLKGLTYAPTGGLVAAATTSLPEKLGGSRNWDYRYCWLRDATFTLFALMTSGYTREACEWRDWLLRAVAGSPSQMQIMYGLAGEHRLPEMTLDWLPGYAGSRPVRIGNAAYQQFQLDVYGEVMDAFHHAREAGLEPDENTWHIQRVLIEFLESSWRKPDEGIWEVRGSQRQFTHSKVMAWVAVDRAVKAIEHFGLKGSLEHWKRLRQNIHEEVCLQGYNPRIGAFVQSYGSPHLDASLLMIPLVGFLPISDVRVQGTIRAIEQRLTHDGFVYRYASESDVDGLPAGEGTFLLCTFWMIDNLALSGRHQEACQRYEKLLALRNDVGLLSEEYDPKTGHLLGNFPQAFSHVALVNSAWNLLRANGPAKRRQRD